MRGLDLIDWVKRSADDKWQSRNLTNLTKTGFEANVALHAGACRMDFGYAFMDQGKQSGEWISNYVLDYLRNKVTFGVSHPVYRGLSACWQFRFQSRCGTYTKYSGQTLAGVETPYPSFSLLDLKINRQFGRFNLYLSANNLFNVPYYDIGNIPQPGFWLTGGITACLF
jgi:iron complex outermembrane receptor protein